MNVLEGLREIRERLVANNAERATLDAVDQIIRRAALPAASQASSQSLLQLVRMLMRTPLANNNTRVYNDFVRLEEELDSAAASVRAQRAEEEARPVPKTKKFYKEQKQKKTS
jgi:hypothetical protein